MGSRRVKKNITLMYVNLVLFKEPDNGCKSLWVQFVSQGLQSGLLTATLKCRVLSLRYCVFMIGL